MTQNLADHFNQGNALFKQQRFAEALQQYDLGLALRPGQPRLLLNRGQALRNLGRHGEAIEALEASARAEPGNPEPLKALGQLLYAMRRPDEAAACAARALALDPRDAAQQALRGVALRMARRPKEAIAAFRAAQALDPSGRYMSYIGGCELLLGDFEQGWRDFDTRGHSRQAAERAARKAPKWTGQDPRGKTILVHAEQGLGDSIHFSRYLPMMAAAGAKVLFAPQPPLRRLFASLDWPRTAAPMTLADLADPDLRFDYQVRTMSLPLAFSTRLETIPARTPYLSAEPELVSQWRSILGERGFKIGVAWKGSDDAAKGGRNFDPRWLAPIARLPGVRLINLQKDDPEHDRASLDAIGIETLAPELDAGKDAFVDTAAVIAACDQVITLDSAVAHLAGALARPAWIALSRHGEWRWLEDRADSPWYPTARLWRQTTLDDWAPVFHAMRAELELGSYSAPDAGAP